MAKYPNAVWKPLPRNSEQPAIKPVGVVLHTAVSNGSSLYDFFNGRSNGVESHFYVKQDGSVEQYMDTGIRADCQLDGNSWTKNGVRYGFLSIETWDGGKPDTTPWNQKQLDSIVSIIAWASKTHGFPAVRANSAQGTGIGYHAQFTSTSFPRWNETHSCPAKLRTAQVPDIIKSVQARLTGPVSPSQPVPEPPMEDDNVTLQAFTVEGKGGAVYVRDLRGVHHIENSDLLDWHRAQGKVTKTTVHISAAKFKQLSEVESNNG